MSDNLGHASGRHALVQNGGRRLCGRGKQGVDAFIVGDMTHNTHSQRVASPQQKCGQDAGLCGQGLSSIHFLITQCNAQTEMGARRGGDVVCADKEGCASSHTLAHSSSRSGGPQAKQPQNY